ncbi:sensor histidine kinase [uncultured Robinsoniella sp.]|uniref:sensor histidine kinase n=1 Tax=uncultured Robinsoniella sp. TaxID=904190 RepID=UPI00374E9670
MKRIKLCNGMGKKALALIMTAIMAVVPALGVSAAPVAGNTEELSHLVTWVEKNKQAHFLYNSLDMIIKLSEMKKYRESQRVAKKLADYYRNTLSDSQEVIRLERELMIVEDYMELLQMRYYNLFTYRIKVRESDLKNRWVPKLILQPLIENAVYHGLKYKGEKGTIDLSVEAEGNRIIIKIIDNGVGMPKHVLEAYRLGEKIDNHFGIYSVNHRIKLFYGESYGLSFADVSEGTTAILSLPL